MALAFVFELDQGFSRNSDAMTGSRPEGHLLMVAGGRGRGAGEDELIFCCRRTRKGPRPRFEERCTSATACRFSPSSGSLARFGGLDAVQFAAEENELV